ncbi:DUF4129 domain-containing protein [Mycobacterium deserti]|uniref:DUF4129 domain-containing protein n=1 Tax=Mycobacterium deserti TaxID=2978347 RepID=A0ABT2MJ34_9MYCO|nr:DUF4129 domain-containing protein [Mycobacterium deserti]MCT7661435.1 DUF4129 domain-containing protein [Mycobacterium deserti]
MARTDNSTRRVITVIALMILAALALRGYLPGTARAEEREPPDPDSPLALFVVVGLVCVAVAIIGFAVLTRLRDRRPVRPSAGELPRSPGVVGRPTRRFAMIALALLIGWLLLVVLLLQIDGPNAVEQPAMVDEPVPADPGPSEPRPQRPEPEAGNGVIGYLVPPMLVFMGLVMIGTAVASVRQRRRMVQTPADDVVTPALTEAPAAAGSLARAAEVGLAEIGDLSREPREAIIACYAAMERELTRVPGAVPQDCDTPSEVLARAVARGALRADSATELVELFEEARFSPHVMAEVHRDVAVRVLERVLAELPHRSVT